MLTLVSLPGYFFFKRAVSMGFPGIWAWFHRLLGAKTNRLQTDKGSLRSQDVGSRHSERRGRRRAVCLTEWPELWASALGLSAKWSPPRGNSRGCQVLLPRLNPQFILLVGRLVSILLFYIQRKSCWKSRL